MAKPQDLPAGENQLFIAIAFNFVTYVLALAGLVGIGGATLHAAVDLACTGLFIYLGLMLVGRLPRFEQSYGALCGAGAILNLAAIPILHLTVATEVPQTAFASGLGDFARFILLVWSLSLVGHVLRHTFSLSMFVSILIAVAYYVLITIVLSWLFPPDIATDQMSMFSPTIGYLTQVG